MTRSDDLKGYGGASDAGFSVLEAIIAIAVLAIAFLPLLSLQGSFVNTIESLERADSRIAAREMGINFITVTNFDARPSGSLDIGDTEFSWTSTIVKGPEIVRGIQGYPGHYTITLYAVDLAITQGDLRTETLSANGLGWTKTILMIDGLN